MQRRSSRLSEPRKGSVVERVGRSVETVREIRRSLSASTGSRPRKSSRPPSYATKHRSEQVLAASAAGDFAQVSTLLDDDSDVDVDMEDTQGRTALHHACRHANLDAVRSIACRSNNVNSLDHARKSAFMEAQDRGADDIADYLKIHGAIDSGKYMSKKEMGGSMETGDVVDPTFFKKLVLALLLPFIILLLMQGSLFLVCFMLATVLWFCIVSAYLVSELAICPPWYHPTPGRGKELSNFGLPAYWQGVWTNPKYDLDLDYEDVEIASDGYKLRGWWVPAEGDRCVVFVHGGGRDRRAWLRHVKMFREEGKFNCLLFDFREHGTSDGKKRGFTYGIRESRDVRAAARWVKECKGMRTVAAVGTSVGGSAVLIAAADSADIDAVVAENPITQATALQLHHLRIAVEQYVGSGRVITFLRDAFGILSAFILKCRIGLFEPEGIQIINRLGKPLLLTHGTGDDVVPHEHSEELFAQASEPKELWLAADAFHCGLYDKYPEEFLDRVIGFLRRHLS
ncbi:hypothetical protein DIPPA_26051 [Diplonema papillatum]|nr:hypothetical protein DIPPA_26051 [Diplonema papillatum]|eukprot:gene8047-12369_t